MRQIDAVIFVGEIGLIRIVIWKSCLAVLFATVMAILVWEHWYGSQGMIAVLVAASLCVFPAVFALWLWHRIRQRVGFPVDWMIATIVRTFPPLIAIVIFVVTKSELVEAGIFAAFGLFYLLTLLLETLLSVRLLQLENEDGEQQQKS